MGKASSILNLNRDENHMIFKYVFEFRLQICRSQDPSVFTLSHMATIVAIIFNYKRNSITITPWKHSSFNENSHIWGYKISHNIMVQTISILNLNRDENHMIFKNVFQFRLQICRSQDPPVFKLSHMAMIVAIWDSLKTGGASTANEIR